MNDYSVHWSSIEGQDYKDVFNSCRVAVVDKNVLDLYGHDNNTYGFLDHIIIQEAKEELKTPETCLSICNRLLEYGFKRGENLLAIGGGILRKKFIDTFKLGILNLHGSGPLPYYRGLGSLEFALIDRKQIYMNVHYIDPGIDTGTILSQIQLPLNGKETLRDIYAKIYADGMKAIVDTIETIMVENSTGQIQKKDDGRQHFLPHPLFEKLALRRLAELNELRSFRNNNSNYNE